MLTKYEEEEEKEEIKITGADIRDIRMLDQWTAFEPMPVMPVIDYSRPDYEVTAVPYRVEYNPVTLQRNFAWASLQDT